MEFEFIEHAKFKMGQRKIPKEFVYKTLAKPHHVHYQIGGRNQYFRKFTKLYLKVVARKEKDKFIVITVHWIDKLPRK